MTLREWMESQEPPRTQADLAKDLKVDQTIVSKWLSGDRSPSLKNAFAIQRLTDGAIPADSWLPKRKGGKAA